MPEKIILVCQNSPVVDWLVVNVFGDKSVVNTRPVDDIKQLNEEILSVLEIGVDPSNDELQHQLLWQRPRLLHQEDLGHNHKYLLSPD